jgi:hypothetical protein
LSLRYSSPFTIGTSGVEGSISACSTSWNDRLGGGTAYESVRRKLCALSRGYTGKLRRSAASSHVGAKHGFPRAWPRIDGHPVDTAAKSLALTMADWLAWLVCLYNSRTQAVALKKNQSQENC